MAADKPTVLILSFTHTARDPRVQKQIRALADECNVVTAGFGSGNEGIEHLSLGHRESPIIRERLGSLLKMFRLHKTYSNWDANIIEARRTLADRSWDVVVVNDIEPVPLAFELKPTNGVLSDLHEYYPRLGDDNWLWRFLTAPYYRWILRKHVANARATTTVSPTFVERYRDEYGLSPSLVVNASPYQDLSPSPVHRPIKLVHSGIGSRGRQIEVMIDAVKASTANVTLDLLLVQLSEDYRSDLIHSIGDDDRIQILPPVPYGSLITTLNAYDVGIHLLHPTNFNHRWTIPNKIYDYVQARLGVITGPTHEMAKLVREYELGIVTDGFTTTDLAKALNSLTLRNVESWKIASDRSALKLSSEEPERIWRNKVLEMLRH